MGTCMMECNVKWIWQKLFHSIYGNMACSTMCGWCMWNGVPHLLSNACNYEDDACEMMCSHYQCIQSCGWCMWNDVPPLIISACNHEVKRLKKILSNLNNYFFKLFFHNFYWPNTKSPLILVFSFFFWFFLFYFQPSAITLGTGFLILALFASLCQ